MTGSIVSVLAGGESNRMSGFLSGGGQRPAGFGGMDGAGGGELTGEEGEGIDGEFPALVAGVAVAPGEEWGSLGGAVSGEGDVGVVGAVFGGNSDLFEGGIDRLHQVMQSVLGEHGDPEDARGSAFREGSRTARGEGEGGLADPIQFGMQGSGAVVIEISEEPEGQVELVGGRAAEAGNRGTEPGQGRLDGRRNFNGDKSAHNQTDRRRGAPAFGHQPGIPSTVELICQNGVASGSAKDGNEIPGSERGPNSREADFKNCRAMPLRKHVCGTAESVDRPAWQGFLAGGLDDFGRIFCGGSGGGGVAVRGL